MYLILGLLVPGVTARSHRRIRRPLIHIAGGPWTTPTFGDSTAGDTIEGEDPLVRYAAVKALGPFSGAVVVVDAQTGQVLTIVNQKLAVTQAFQPCSTIKLLTAAGGLSDDIIHADTMVRTGRRRHISLTRAFEFSSNRYFSYVGSQLGFDRFMHYARTFGLGEAAGLNIEDETPGVLPDAPPPEEDGGLGMMTSFGLGIAVTPLQLAAIVSAIANDGTLYYLQHPRTRQHVSRFVPRVKRHLDIGAFIPDVKAGMLAVVEVGTGRGANDGTSDSVFGKTGTCTDARFPTHLGWFASFNHGERRSLAVVVLLTGGRPVNGRLAAGIAGAVYKTLR